MILDGRFVATTGISFPRVGGGDPEYDADGGKYIQFSPRRRG